MGWEGGGGGEGFGGGGSGGVHASAAFFGVRHCGGRGVLIWILMTSKVGGKRNFAKVWRSDGGLD